MTNFSELGINPPATAFVGNKIEIKDILNLQIIVIDYKVAESKFPKNNPNCLHLQIETEGIKRVVFSSSGTLMEMINKVPKHQFPFSTKIIKDRESKRLVFT